MLIWFNRVVSLMITVHRSVVVKVTSFHKALSHMSCSFWSLQTVLLTWHITGDILSLWRFNAYVFYSKKLSLISLLSRTVCILCMSELCSWYLNKHTQNHSCKVFNKMYSYIIDLQRSNCTDSVTNERFSLIKSVKFDCIFKGFDSVCQYL